MEKQQVGLLRNSGYVQMLQNGPIRASFLFIFVLFSLQFQYKLEKA